MFVPRAGTSISGARREIMEERNQMMSLVELIKVICAAASLGLFSSANAAQLISTLSSSDNTSNLMAGDQSNTTTYDWATASRFHVGENYIVVEGITVTFDSTNDDTSRYLELGIFESVGTPGLDLVPGVLIGSFDTSTVYASNTKVAIDLGTHGDFALLPNTDYLLVWNAQPGAPYLGAKKGGTVDQMVNDGVAGYFTGEKAFSRDGGSSWSSHNQYGFDYVSIDGKISAVPVPAAFGLFGTGLLGLIAIARRKEAS
jgi:hypothetical protein